MQFTVGELYAMQQIIYKLTMKEMPIRTAYKLSKFVKKMGDDLRTFDEQRKKLVEKHGEEYVDKNNQKQIKVKQENMEAFRKEIAEVAELEVEIDIEPIKISELGADIQVSPGDLALLDKIIKE